MPRGRAVFGPTQQCIARRLHDTLSLDDPSAGMSLVFRAEAFENGFTRLFDLQEERRSIAAHKQTNRTKRPYATDANYLEGDIFEMIPLKQTQSLWWKSVLI